MAPSDNNTTYTAASTDGVYSGRTDVGAVSTYTGPDRAVRTCTTSQCLANFYSWPLESSSARMLHLRVVVVISLTLEEGLQPGEFRSGGNYDDTCLFAHPVLWAHLGQITSKLAASVASSHSRMFPS